MAVFLIFLFVAEVAGAQETPNIISVADPNSQLQQGVQIIEEPLGLPATDIRLIVANIIRAALALMGIVLLVITIYGGYLWMTSGGNEDQIGKAKKILINAVIGLIIILSAYAIVAFVMRILGVGGMGEGGGGAVAPPNSQNFQGSGALGQTIKDHYPGRNQKGVPRNTKIAITFFKPIKVNDAVLITKKSTDDRYGVCNPQSAEWSWKTDCDELNTSTIMIDRVSIDSKTQQEIYTPISGAAVLASYVSSTDPELFRQVVYTLIIRPYDYLGEETEDVRYRVYLKNNIRIDDEKNNNPFLFADSPTKFYRWYFTCSTVLDLSPPHVIGVYPGDGSREVKNTVLQVVFDEAIDPMGVQGGFDITSDENFFRLQNNGYIFLTSEHSTIPQGGFDLLNKYTTLEFSSTEVCGVNACGKPIYCLPVCDKPNTICADPKLDNYKLLLRAATTFNTSTFEAVPFTGISDMSGNALDGNNDKVVQNAPRTEPIFDTQYKKPDNYGWYFMLEDKLDLTPPYVNKIVPGPEAEWVAPEKEWTMLFSKRMRVGSMYSISIQESPSPAERCSLLNLNGASCILDSIWKVPNVSFFSNDTTQTTMEHGPFLDGLAQVYVPYINSLVEDVNYNCLYPGQGPEHVIDGGSGGKTNPDTDESSVCNNQTQTNCCIKPINATEDFCCNGMEKGLGETAGSSCYDSLKSNLK